MHTLKSCYLSNTYQYLSSIHDIYLHISESTTNNITYIHTYIHTTYAAPPISNLPFHLTSSHPILVLPPQHSAHLPKCPLSKFKPT